MKRILALVLLISSAFALSACDISGNDGIAEGVYTLVGQVVELGENSFTLAVTEGDSKGIDHLVKLTENTDYRYEGKAAKKSDVTLGSKVKVTYDGIATRSIPPQITAKSVVIQTKPGAAVTPKSSGGEGVGEEFKMIAEVLEVSSGAITVDTVSGEYAYGTYVVHVPDITPIFGADGSIINLNGISVGDKPEIVYGGQTTLSLPPQIVAEKITVLE